MQGIEIKQEDSFRIKIGDKDHGVFHVESEWEGIKKLKNHDGEIVYITSSFGNDALSNLIPLDDNWTLLKASPDIIADINFLNKN